MNFYFESSPKSPENLLPLITLLFHCPVIQTIPEAALFQEDQCLLDQRYVGSHVDQPSKPCEGR